MNNIKVIRDRLKLTQADLAIGMGCTQGNVGHYERGQTVPPGVARKLIEFAAAKGLVLSYNDVYMPETAQSQAIIAPAATENVAESGVLNV